MVLLRKKEYVPPVIPDNQLSEREWQVMLGLASGKTVTEIAVQTALSVKTISTYRTRVMLKTGFKTNAELTIAAFKQGLIGGDDATN